MWGACLCEREGAQAYCSGVWGNIISGCVTQGKSLKLSESQRIVVKVERATLYKVFRRLY